LQSICINDTFPASVVRIRVQIIANLLKERFTSRHYRV
jgi:hypothetical protein